MKMRNLYAILAVTITYISIGCGLTARSESTKVDNKSLAIAIIPLDGCSDYETTTTEEYVRRYRVIFTGKVNKLSRPTLKSNMCLTTFAVYEYLKGGKNLNNTHSIDTKVLFKINDMSTHNYTDTKDCPYKLGQEYLIYAYPAYVNSNNAIAGTVSTIDMSCTGSKLLSLARQDIKMIKKIPDYHVAK